MPVIVQLAALGDAWPPEALFRTTAGDKRSVDNGFKPVQADRNDSYEDEEVVALAPDPRIKGRVPVREVH